MKAKLLFVLLVVVCLTFVVGIGDVVAQVFYPVQFTITWGEGTTPQNVNVIAILYGGGLNIIDVAFLEYDSYYEVWTGTLEDPNEEGSVVLFDWDEAELEWSVGPPLGFVQIDPILTEGATTAIEPEA